MPTSGRRRVVVTGLGAVTPLGNDAESFWQGLLEARSGAARISLFDTSPYSVNFGCELKGFDPLQVGRSERLGDVEVVVEAVVRRRPEGHLCLWE